MRTLIVPATAVLLFSAYLALPATAARCDPSYPTVCIPSPLPDLNCADVTHRRFKVVGSDPHHFDGDNDGIGCERD